MNLLSIVCRILFPTPVAAILWCSVAFSAEMPPETPAQSTALQLKRSDVVALYPLDAERQKAYGQTVSGWGWDLAWWYGSFEELQRFNRSGLERGLRIVSSNIELSSATARVLAGDDRLREAVLRDVENRPIAVPWFAPWTHQGVPTLWGCIDHPAYRNHVREKVIRGFQTHTNALHFDMPGGSARFTFGGCFCDHCGEAFKDYLREHHSPEELEREGISDLPTFHYRTAVAAVTPTRETSIRDYVEGQPFPLRYEYERFQRDAAARFIGEMGELAREQQEPDTPVATNAWGMTPETLSSSRHEDFFVAEVNHTSQGPRIKRDVPMSYKLADALGKSLAAFGDGPDYHYIREKGATGLLRSWIALSYALGHQYLVPYGQWVISPDGVQSSEPYTGPTEIFAPLYQFVRRHADLLDDYEPVEQIALLYSSMAVRRGHRQTHEACLELLNHNIPFGVLLAGDDWLHQRLTRRDLERHSLLVVAGPPELYEEQATLVEEALASGRAVNWTDAPSLRKKVPPLCWLEEEKPVWILPRIHRENPDAPLVVHLFNWSYDPKTDAPTEQTNVVVGLATDLGGVTGAVQATLHLPEGDPVDLPIERREDAFVITVPRLSLWGVLEVTKS